MDYQAIYDYLGLNVVPEPATGFDGIYALPAGHCISVDENGVAIRNYWDPNTIKSIPVGFEQAKTDVRSLVNAAVTDQLVSDVPIGSFLSGGIDSSLVVANASQEIKSFPTFTVKFPDVDFDESINARHISDHCGTDHHELNIEASSGEIELIEEKLNKLDILIQYSSAYGDKFILDSRKNG